MSSAAQRIDLYSETKAIKAHDTLKEGGLPADRKVSLHLILYRGLERGDGFFQEWVYYVDASIYWTFEDKSNSRWLFILDPSLSKPEAIREAIFLFDRLVATGTLPKAYEKIAIKRSG